jgi:hypothetical protein
MYYAYHHRNSHKWNEFNKEAHMKKLSLGYSYRALSLGIAFLAMFITSASVPTGVIPVSIHSASQAIANPLLSASALLSAHSLRNTSADASTRIAFATGTTSASVSGSLDSQAVNSYILDAAWNQVMFVTADSPNDNVYLDIYGLQDGAYLTHFSSNSTAWKGWLPSTESYIVQVKNTGSATTTYTLSVEIPARIQFALGAYSGAVWGRGSAAKTIAYVLYASAGQTMTATLSSSTASVYLSIDGFSGNQSLVASSAGKTTWTGTLPQTQEYVIRAVQNSTWVDFTLTVTII